MPIQTSLLVTTAAQASSHWTAYMSAMATPAIALFATWIALRQSKIARNKLKLDLFEKRLAIYNTAREFIRSAVNYPVTNEQKIDYIAATRPAKWLFGKDVFDFIDTVIFDKVIDLELLRSHISNNSDDSERSNHIQAQAELLKWLVKQLSVLDNLCYPYLKLEH